ncbi:MAG TPA: ABC transporter ATP-binding protein [Candidatus Bathyarchaeia archaeon]|nr:ABC transporter ATP-binding protein [Candidatus Bathyarchaeia archaeon]
MSREGSSVSRVASKEKKNTRPIGQLTRELLKYLKGFSGLLIGTGVISILYAAIQLVNPLILSQGIDSINPDTITIDDGKIFVEIIEGQSLPLLSVIGIFAGIFIGLGLIGFILQSISTRFLARARANMIKNIREEIYHKLINSSMSYLKKEQSGNITARITSDTEEIGSGIQVIVDVGIQFMVLIATLIVLIVRTGWQILLITIGTVPAALILSLVFSKIGRRIILNIRQAFGEVSGKMAESISGIAVSKSFVQEGGQAQQMRVLNETHYKMNIKFGLMVNIVFPLIGMIASIATAAILLAGGAINLSPGEIFLGVTLANLFLLPVIILSFSFPQLQSALGSLDRVIDVLEATSAISDKKTAVPIKSGDRSVTFDNVWFAYNDNNWVLKDISFTANDGEIVALVGETGAGKTTIASMLIPRFFDVQKGSIKIGDQDIRDITQTSLRNTLGLIPQEPYLFSSSIIENIRYGKPDASDNEVFEICKLIGADAFIEALPNGYSTIVNEGGKQLSAGQRQMITIARTMLADPEILILDEATSRLDTYTESLIQEAQEKLFKNRTTFVIAHRLSTIHNADKIIVLDHGKLIEEGNHTELMKLDGIYADVYRTYYAFQGLEEIDLQKFVDEQEEVELTPLALLERGLLDDEALNKLIAEGKITPEILAKVKQEKEITSKNGATA